MTYAEKLKDPRWQKKRLEILSRDNFTCHNCGDTTLTLHVHHLYYFKDEEPWEAEDMALETLCCECHKIQHTLTEFELFLYECVKNRDRDREVKDRISFRRMILRMKETGIIYG